MPPVLRVICGAAVCLSASTLHAQQAERTGAPDKGTWGAEATVGSGLLSAGGSGASLLRFISPRTALVGGLSFSRTSSERIDVVNGDFTSFSTAFSYTSAQLGVRRYKGTGVGLRPVIGGGVLFTRQTGIGGSSTAAGGYGEAGAAWFFNPHVSLGVLGGVSAVKNDSGWLVGGSLARLTGAVYF